jgi:hypothetical protein
VARKVGGHFQAYLGDKTRQRVKEMAMDGVCGEVFYLSFTMDPFGLQDDA